MISAVSNTKEEYKHIVNVHQGNVVSCRAP